jgi:sporulation and cell division repeat protein
MRKLKKEGFTHANVIRTMVTIETSKVVGNEPDVMDY